MGPSMAGGAIETLRDHIGLDYNPLAALPYGDRSGISPPSALIPGAFCLTVRCIQVLESVPWTDVRCRELHLYAAFGGDGLHADTQVSYSACCECVLVRPKAFSILDHDLRHKTPETYEQKKDACLMMINVLRLLLILLTTAIGIRADKEKQICLWA
jgi:hypothetical protein